MDMLKDIEEMTKKSLKRITTKAALLGPRESEVRGGFSALQFFRFVRHDELRKEAGRK